MLTDAHIHFIDLGNEDPGFPERFAGSPYVACAASHDEPEFEATMALAGRGLRFVPSFGIHPQWPVWKNADFLAALAAKGRIAAIGEAGFDFFGDTPERVRNEENEKTQKAVFEFQLELAEKNGLPLLLHLRKASDRLFAYAPRLARLPAVVIHSYPGTAKEGLDLLKRGVPAFFSFGSTILNNHKKAIEAASLLPADRLLSETDAPWQPPRGLPFCRFETIADVVAGLARLRATPQREMETILAANFIAAYPAASRFFGRPR
jgi:TatD DNase family protein